MLTNAELSLRLIYCGKMCFLSTELSQSHRVCSPNWIIAANIFFSSRNSVIFFYFNFSHNEIDGSWFKQMQLNHFRSGKKIEILLLLFLRRNWINEELLLIEKKTLLIFNEKIFFSEKKLQVIKLTKEKWIQLYKIIADLFLFSTQIQLQCPPENGNSF